MCGICGYIPFKSDCPIDEGLLRRMTDILYHRGPDSDGFYVAPGVGLGVRRLSIIDLVTGDQPISNEDGTVTVVCNGEIYNFKELRQRLLDKGHRLRTKSDVEVIVHLYEDHDVECLRYLRGMFGFALWDSRKRRLMLARDRLGIKPLNYAMAKDGFYFASESKSILASEAVEREADPCALHDLFTLGFVSGTKTLFPQIRRLLPGHYLIFKKDDFSVHRYWQVDFSADQRNHRRWKEADYAQAFLSKLEEAVRIHMRSDVEVAAWLSPGIDSSSVVSLMRSCTAQQIRVFSIGFEDKAVDEIGRHKTLDSFKGYEMPVSKVIFKARDFSLFPKALWHMEDPLTSGVEVPRLVLSRLCGSQVKVVLTGEGADEILGGYEWYRTDQLLNSFSRTPFFLRQAVSSLLNKNWPGAGRILLTSPTMNLSRYSRLIGMTRTEEFGDKLFGGDYQGLWDKQESKEDAFLPQGFFRWPRFLQLQYFDITRRLPGSVIHQLDRSSMAYSLEARVPFLDHEFVEFCAKIPHL
jgi:asparagine synthase (glutamine-hydrolysing)